MTESDSTSERSAFVRNSTARVARGMLQTVPIVLAGTMAMSMTFTGPLFSHDQNLQAKAPKPGIAPAPSPRDLVIGATDHADPATGSVDTDASVALVAASVSAPSSYTVITGDTVAGIAKRFGLATASVLAMNGLSWKSTIFPGQKLTLTTAPAPVAVATPAPAASSGTYTIVRGDTLSAIASKHGVSTASLIAANGLAWTSIVFPGQTLRIPGASAPTAAAATPVATVSAPTASAGSYAIKTGDTLSSIAKSHGTTIDALLSANALTYSSTIYAGKILTIPGANASTGVTSAATVSTAAPVLLVTDALTAEQQSNARTIIRIGRQLGASDYALVIALSAAAQESSLRNIAYGDRDSVGLFQQRPSQGWGTKAQLTDTAYATRLFFGGASNPNRGVTRGLFDIGGWSGMSVTAAAQAVQQSAFPTAYAKWQGPAQSWLAHLG